MVAKKDSGLRVVHLSEGDELHALVEPWQGLADLLQYHSLFRGPYWLMAWWRSYQQQLGASLYSFAVFDGETLLGLAPMYRRELRRRPKQRTRTISGIATYELRLLGDAGPRPPALGFLCQPGMEERVGRALADELFARVSEWDVLDLEPLEDPSALRAHFLSRLSTHGLSMESNVAGGVRRIELQASGLNDHADENKDVLVYGSDTKSLRKGLATLRRLSRLEWADRDEASPFADRQATHLLEDVMLPLSKAGKARLSRLSDADGEAIAAALVVDDGVRAVVLAIAVDPEVPSAAPRLLAEESRAAVSRGLHSLDLCASLGDHELPRLPSSRQRSLHLCVYGSSSSAAIARTYGKVRRGVDVTKSAPIAATAGARAAWSRIRTAASQVAGVERMLLYRGELWTRGIAHPPGLNLRYFSEENFAELSPEVQTAFLRGLQLEESEVEQRWKRGDLSVLADLNGVDAGIGWCALQPVPVPELGRTLRLGSGEAYIYEMYVAPWARGRSIAPSILEFLAKDLRQRDIYKSWALIRADNAASVRAFEKAAYTSVAEIVHAHIAGVDKLVVRPPDPGAKALLGL